MKEKNTDTVADFFEDSRTVTYFTDKILHEDADLHLHTYYSDGSMSPTDIVKRAHSQGKSLISVTDHDGIDGVPEAVKAGKDLGIEVIPGIEFSTADKDGIKMHMLGYLIDTKNKHLQEELEDIRAHRIVRNEKLLAILNEMGYVLTEQDLVMREGQEFIGKPIFARALAAKRYIDFPEQAFGPGGIFRSKEIRAIKKNVIDTRLAMDLIHEAGGKAVLAHPGKIRLEAEAAGGAATTKQNFKSAVFYSRAERLIKGLVEAGLDGLECYHTDHTVEDTQNFLRIARKYNLWITRGSDYHGPEFEKRMG